MGLRSAPVSRMREPEKLRGGPREHVVYKGSCALHFHATCFCQMNRGTSVDDFGGPMTPPHAIYEGSWPSPSPPWGLCGVHIVLNSAPVIPVSNPQKLRGGPREHAIDEGIGALPFFTALASAKCVEAALMTTLVPERAAHLVHMWPASSAEGSFRTL
jgi:hypothetical protein